MATVPEIKPKEVRITTENLRFVAGLNGYTVTELATQRDCSDTLLYQACRFPKIYPEVYAWLCLVLPRRTT
jgi:hypothetical protein